MHRILFAIMTLCFSISVLATTQFMPVQVASSDGKVLADISGLNSPFLLVATLERALGSNDIGLDRAQNTDPMLVEFRHIGNRIYLVQLNTHYTASSLDADELKATRDAFAESVLWAGDVRTSKNTPHALIVDISSLLLNDFVGLSDRLQARKQGNYQLDIARSSVLPESISSYPDNTELSAMLTFSGEGNGAYVQQIAADPKSLSITQRLSFVRLPDKGFSPRAFHPASGGFSISHFDFAQGITQNLDIHLQPRFRLEKINPNAAHSKVVKPIVFYLDRGTPEPIRSALLEGANWWRSAFEAAGFDQAFRAELAPEGMSMSDVRYNTITWTHRATRGWSYGGGLIDPRTGEIIKGYVNLGSQRVRQDLLIAEGLLAPYKNGTNTDLLNEAQNMALQRLRQLAAHEVGHALGFAHNFAASRSGNGSVLDYPHPMVTLNASNQPQLDSAYRTGLGDWDYFVVAHAYSQFPTNQEMQGLAKLRADIAVKGYDYVSDADARAPGDSHQAGLLWDLPGGAIEGLNQILRVRHIALDHFSEGALPPDRQLGETEQRLVPIYLLHRYQTEAVIRLIGGSTYHYGLIGDTPLGEQAVPAAQQKMALIATAKLLSLDTLRIPNSVLQVMTPPSVEYARGPEYFGSKMSPNFDALQATQAATALVMQFALAAERLNRVAWQHSQDTQIPAISDVFKHLIQQPCLEPRISDADALLQDSRNWTLINAALLALDKHQLQPAVESQWRAALVQLAAQLQTSKNSTDQHIAWTIQHYLENPSSVKLQAITDIPPGSPI